MSENKDKSDNIQTANVSGSSFGSLPGKLPNSFDMTLDRLKLVFGVKTDTDFARCLGIKQGSISGAKQKQAIPPAWITEVAATKGASADWLLTGEGEMMRGAAPAQPAPVAAAPRQDAIIYNDTGLKKSNISDLVAKTIEVLQSNTVFQFALESNIEAFHQAIILERKIDQVEGVLSKRLDALEADNARLKEELASCRVRDELSDTG